MKVLVMCEIWKNMYARMFMFLDARKYSARGCDEFALWINSIMYILALHNINYTTYTHTTNGTSTFIVL